MGGGRGTPGADLHPAPFQHPYTRTSTNTPPGVHSLLADLQLPLHPVFTRSLPASPSSVHSLVASPPIVETSHLPHNPSHISIRQLSCSLINATSTSSNKNFPGCIRTLPISLRLFSFEPSLTTCPISAHDPRAPLGLWAHLSQPVTTPIDPLFDIKNALVNLARSTGFGLCPFKPSLPSCAICAHGPRAPLGLWAH